MCKAFSRVQVRVAEIIPYCSSRDGSFIAPCKSSTMVYSSTRVLRTLYEYSVPCTSTPYRGVIQYSVQCTRYKSQSRERRETTFTCKLHQSNCACRTLPTTLLPLIRSPRIIIVVDCAIDGEPVAMTVVVKKPKHVVHCFTIVLLRN
jgi:hypothetical protein